jgi:hypothetical protein
MTILNLGRLGDNVNLLPVAYANKGATFVTSEKYAPIFEGTSYCQTKKYSGDPVELQHCINLCQGLPNLRVAQVFMHPKETKQEKNYALESYRLGGFRDQWRKHPYVFDRRNPEREQKLIPESQFIAVAPHGVSSPFAHSKQLIAGLQSRFPEYKIVDLSNIQAEKPFDLLGILDAASCLVTIDTLHLWLANAAKCPTVALINDGWYGSPPPVTATSTFRYSQFQIDQICDEVEKTLLPTGEIWAIVDRFGKEKRHREAFKSQKQAFDSHKWRVSIVTRQDAASKTPSKSKDFSACIVERSTILYSGNLDCNPPINCSLCANGEETPLVATAMKGWIS